MVRKIRFRGKDTQNEWVYGDLFHAKKLPGVVSIIDDEGINHIVSQDSVGQFTGLQDKNGKDIYEGDVIAVERELNFKKEHILHTEIKWSDYGNGMVGWTQFSPPHLWDVVCNIHDNPELTTF